jgi:hypothetical protein
VQNNLHSDIKQVFYYRILQKLFNFTKYGVTKNLGTSERLTEDNRLTSYCPSRNHIAVLYLGIRQNIISARHSICGLVLSVFEVGKILCIATQIPYTWFFPFFRGLWTLPAMGTM